MIDRFLASDNYAGICLEALDGILQANLRHTKAYGNDPWSEQAKNDLQNLFQTDCEVFFVFNGTAANALALTAVCKPYQAILCHSMAHIEHDECGAPGFFSPGLKLKTINSNRPKLIADDIANILNKNTPDVHRNNPQAISISQTTELGLVYTSQEIKNLSAACKKHNLLLHMDGARFANACASLNCNPADISWKAGVDILCFGGTKNGMAFGEAIVVFNKKCLPGLAEQRKRSGQLASKMRFMSSQWINMLKTGAWLKHAQNANKCAKLLEKKISAIPNIEIIHSVDANAIFVKIPTSAIEKLYALDWQFYIFIEPNIIRLMCSWATTIETIDAFAEDLVNCMK